MRPLRRFLIVAALLALAVPALALAAHGKQGVYLKRLKDGTQYSVGVAKGGKKVTYVSANCTVKGFSVQGYNITKELSVNSKGRFYFHGKIKLASQFGTPPIATLTLHGRFVSGGKYVKATITGTQRSLGKKYTCQKVALKLKYYGNPRGG
jgi:hypothetical protein